MDDKQSVKGNRTGLRVGVIAGSTRPVRQARVVAEWVVFNRHQCEFRSHSDVLRHHKLDSGGPGA